MNSVVISIGSFTVGELQQVIRKFPDWFYLCFEPLPSVAAEFETVFGKELNVEIYPYAVNSYNGFNWLYIDGSKSSFIEIPNKSRIAVHVESLVDVIKRCEQSYGQDCEKVLLLNCEGSEISILLNTPVEVLSKFILMKVEFHPKLYPEKNMQDCIDRLSPFFDYRKSYTSSTKHPIVQFRLKR